MGWSYHCRAAVILVVIIAATTRSEHYGQSPLLRYRRQSTSDGGLLYFPEEDKCPPPARLVRGSYLLSNWKCPPQSSNPDCKIPPGARVPLGWKLLFSCDTRNTVTVSSICLRTGWTPPLETACVGEREQLCPPLKPVNGAVRCVFQDKEVPCDAPMKPDTKATLLCKIHYRPVQGPENPQIRCLPTGQWNTFFYNCVPRCGHSNGAVQVTALIYHGLNATVGLFPWHAGIYYRQEIDGKVTWEQRCGGSLISDQFVLTAAHCVIDHKEQNMNVALGKYYRSWDHYEPTAEKRGVSKILYPIVFNKRTLVFDIALVQLDEKIQLGEFIMPVCHGYADGSNNIMGKNLLIVGWGRTEDVVGGRSSETLRYNDVKMVDARTCQRTTPSFYHSNDKFCTTKNNYTVSAALPGDSGGGLTAEFDGLHYIFGIVSQKIDKYSLFTNLTYQLHSSWIENEMRKFDTSFRWVENNLSGSYNGTSFNECENNPCHFGKCINEIYKYHCECENGYEGVNCELEIDDCERYKPCVHGTCYDLKTNYYCECLSGYTGKNCSVELTGCKENQCMNNGICQPYLDIEREYFQGSSDSRDLFNCSCTNGYHGRICEQPTTMSMNGASYLKIITSREEGHDLQFRFKTTLPNVLLAIGKGSTFYILQLQNGYLNLHSAILNNLNGVSIGSELNNGSWQKVFVTVSISHLVFGVNEEQAIYPVTISEAGYTSFPTTYLGGAEPEIYSNANMQQGQRTQPLVGCVQDVVVNGQWVLASESQKQAHVMPKDIEVGCPRKAQCEPNPCRRGTTCTDLWRTYSCS